MKILRFLLVIITAVVFYYCGKIDNQQEIEDRALTMNKECYSGTDLGFIIKNIPQP